MEHIELEHNKKITLLFSLLYVFVIAALVACIVLTGINFNNMSESVGIGLTIAVVVLLSLCTLAIFILFVSQICKIRRKIIFIADENGICDYSRHIVLKPVSYGEIESIEYKEFLSDDASDLRHLKIVLKNKRDYMKRLNLLQKISYLLCLRHIELHLFCAKTNIKNFADKLKRNLEIYNQTNL